MKVKEASKVFVSVILAAPSSAARPGDRDGDSFASIWLARPAGIEPAFPP